MEKLGSVLYELLIDDVNDMTSQALLDYLTNHRNVAHVHYKKNNYLLNQKEVIALEDDYNAVLVGQTKDTQTVELFSYVHCAQEIRKFVEKAVYNYSLTVKNKLEKNTKYYFNMVPVKAPITYMPNDITHKPDEIKNYSKLPPTMEFIMKPFQTNRKFTNLFGEDVALIRNRVKFFVENRRWYDDKGIPYTLGLLLSGPPGTGKTSTIKCIANETNRHIINVNLNNDVTKAQLENLFSNETIVVQGNQQQGSSKANQMPHPLLIPSDQRIYVLEDVDCQMQNRELTGDNEAYMVDLSFMLNLLDGVLETPGRILIMTSNYPERLDKALIRPGRIDVLAKLDNCTNSTMIKMIEYFYERSLKPKEREFIMSLPERHITPAELSRIMFEHMTNIQEALRAVSKYVQDVSNAADIIVQDNWP
jgi:hypothetical protein